MTRWCDVCSHVTCRAPPTSKARSPPTVASSLKRLPFWMEFNMPLTEAQIKTHQAIADALVKQMHEHDELIPLDIEKFWHDQDLAIQDPFNFDNPQCPLGMLMSGECVYDELGIEEDFWRYQHDPDWRAELHKAYNDKAQRIVGRRLLPEGPFDPEMQFKGLKRLHDVFEMENHWHAGSWWLHASATTPSELSKLLDRVDRLDLRSFIFPDDWEQQKQRLIPQGVLVPRYMGQRGPCTFATSLMETENFLFLLMDEPELAQRLSDTILRVMIQMRRLMDEHLPPHQPRHPGFGFADDNSALLTPELYEAFAYPILQGMFDECSPDPGDRRFQHSDSEMSHLLPILARTGMNATNFGPTVSVEDIRHHMPHAVIHGELAPFTLSRHELPGIVMEFLRDFTLTYDTRGLVFATAGSINNGSRLTAMRLLMATIQQHGRYDG